MNVSNRIGCLEYDLDFRIYGYGTFMSRDLTTCYNHKSFECDATVASLREYSGIGFGIVVFELELKQNTNTRNGRLSPFYENRRQILPKVVFDWIAQLDSVNCFVRVIILH